MMNKKDYYENCQKCGRSFPKAVEKPCGCGCKAGIAEYGHKVSGCIRNKNPECPMNAVIPAVTVENISGIKNLRDCFVHVTSINTTFYVDDKGRMMVTWAGPIEIRVTEDTDVEALRHDLVENAGGYRSQFVIVADPEGLTGDPGMLAFYADKQGKMYGGVFYPLLEDESN